ncbi:hypothetical protein Bhyg_10256, partial [Pseudolycoriella hygida]
MYVFQRNRLRFGCFLYLFAVLLCVVRVKSFVVNDKINVSNKSSDLLTIVSSNIEDAFAPNGLNYNKLDKSEGRQIGGHHHHHHGSSGGFGHKKKGKHLRRILYPVLMGLFIAKLIIFPLLLKVLTIMSSASFVLSKMSLLSTIMLGFKWFLTQHQVQPQQESKVEVVHVPLRKFNNQHNEWERDADINKYSMPVLSDNNDNYYNEHEMNLKPTSYVK